jgi:hypothetical protein
VTADPEIIKLSKTNTMYYILISENIVPIEIRSNPKIASAKQKSLKDYSRPN